MLSVTTTRRGQSGRRTRNAPPPFGADGGRSCAAEEDKRAAGMAGRILDGRINLPLIPFISKEMSSARGRREVVVQTHIRPVR